MPPTPLDSALLYAELHRGNPGDLAHYVDVCADARSVLELGSGAGRVALHLAAKGLEVTGLELDEGLSALARSRAQDEPPEVRARLAWRAGDMRDMDLGRTFDRVLLPYNGLYCLDGEQGVLACFERVAEHLTPDGEFWLDVYVADTFHAEAPEDEGEDAHPHTDDEALDHDPGRGEPLADRDRVAELEVAQRRLQVFEDTRWSREDQRLEVSYRFCDGDRVVTRQTLIHHYLLAPEIVFLLSEAGLEVVRCSGGFGGEPYDEDAELLVLGTRRRTKRSR